HPPRCTRSPYTTLFRSGDKKPAAMDAEAWAREKTMLPQVYPEMAVISLMQQNLPDAQGKLEKAARLNPADPFNNMLLGSIANDEDRKSTRLNSSHVSIS